MHAPLTTDRQKYYQLMALVCEDLPTTAIDALVRKEHKATAAQLTAVRHARKAHLPWLLDLVRIGLPDFHIPAELLPVTPARVAVPVLDL
ncbi:MAG: hypothetical protein ACRYF0_17555 [Janthinobacterium lividum]